jgi:hypothetical protein
MPSQQTTFTTAGSFSYTIPQWAGKFDVAVLGGGGSGDTGGAGFNTGAGGGQATWQTVTWTRGVQIPWATNSFTVVVGNGGVGPAPFGTRQAGGNSSVTAPSGPAVTSTGGITFLRLASGHGQAGDSAVGITFNGIVLPGGTGGTGNAGNAAVYGSGGAGGNGVFLGSSAGGSGSRGYVSIVAYGDNPAFFAMF